MATYDSDFNINASWSEGYSYNGQSEGNATDYDYDDDYYYEYEDDPEFDEAEHLYRMMLMVGVVPISVLGIVANCLSFHVWHATKKTNPVILLFKCLTIWDILFLLFVVVRSGCLFAKNLTAEHYMFLMTFLAQVGSVYTTLTIAIYRWLAVQKSNRMSPIRIRYAILTILVVAIWCAMLTGIQAYVEETLKHNVATWETLSIVLQIVAFVLPVLALTGFSINLLWTARSRLHGLGQRNKRHRTTLAVLCIAGCSFLACPVGVMGHIVPNYIHDTCNYMCSFALHGVADLMQVLNSSVNFFFYFFFASRFRSILCLTLFRRPVDSSQDRGSTFSVSSSSVQRKQQTLDTFANSVDSRAASPEPPLTTTSV